MRYLFGASGHGLVILDILQKQNISVEAFIDDADKPSRWGGIPVLKSGAVLWQPDDEIIVCIGVNETRKKVVHRLENRRFRTAIHPTAVIGSGVTIGTGTVVMAGAILNPDTTIGVHSIINTGAVVDHECSLGNFVHVSPQATLCGNVEVGNGSWIGAGATLIQGVKIGNNCVVGAGSVVIKDVAAGEWVVGNPARVIRKAPESV